MNDKRLPKHAQIFAALDADIRSGRWRPGERMPSEAELVKRFGVSRITVSRAVRDLQRARLVHRRPGSGTYVTGDPGSAARSFGLLIPDLGQTEIFEPICRGMMASPLADQHALLWGNSPAVGQSDNPASRAECAWHLCRQYIERRVSGVFFAPLEHDPEKDLLNQRIADELDRAGIPIVLLDRPLLPFPAPIRHDLVGIDNRRAGYVVTEHLLGRGCRRILFVSETGAAPTVDDREAGYREALYARQLPFESAFIQRVDPHDDDAIRALLKEQRPDGIVCTNDRTAGALMHTIGRLAYRVPRDVRLVGIDDIEYASLLPVPLTTLRQPTRLIGDAAISMMLDRIERRELPPRDVRLPCELVVRESCGGIR